MKLSCFVLFILIGSTVFSLSFQGVDGPKWVEHLLTSLPGGQLGFLIVVNILIFFLAFFLDFFELVVHRHPADRAGGRQARHRPGLVRRAARGEHADLVHAPAVRLRAVLPAQRRAARTTTPTRSPRKPIAQVTTGQIYWGAVPFVLIQVVMVGLIIAFPTLVSSGLGKEPTVDVDKAFQQMQMHRGDVARRADDARSAADASAPRAGGEPRRRRATEPPASSDDDAMKRLLESMQSDAAKKP